MIVATLSDGNGGSNESVGALKALKV